MATRKSIKKPITESQARKYYGSIKFFGINTNLRNFDYRWDQKRGFIARSTVAILGLSDDEMERKFLGSDESAHALMDLHDAIEAEKEYLRLHVDMLTTATSRILAVCHRYKGPTKTPGKHAEMSHG